MAKPIKLFIRDREKIIFEGDVANVSSSNKKGIFDILDHHANFIALIGEQLIVRNLDGSKKEYPIDSGIVKVVANDVKIYLGVKK